MRIAIVLAAAALIGGCATAPRSWPVEVTRFHTDEVGRGTITVVPDEGTSDGAEFRTYANAIGDALTARGYTVVPGAPSTYVARVSLKVDRRTIRGPAPFTLGLGGGGYSGGYRGGVGVGGSVGIPIGKGKLKDQVATTLSVKIDTRDGNLGVWEGRALAREEMPAGSGDATRTAPRIATALFTGFPGDSGRTIEVK